jgi:hypothetical protein
MSGALGGMDGAAWRAVRRAYAAVAALILCFDLVDVFTILHDRAVAGRPLPWWEPALWEGSSGVAMLTATPIVYLALRLAPPRPSWIRFTLVHGPATLLFSLVHVGLMVAIRMAVYAAAGGRYATGPGQFPYEFRKDVIAYAVAALLFWAFTEIQARRRAPDTAPADFDIIEGSKVIRTRPGEILAVSSAGNYVEFLLADGRRPLMRTTLAAVEAVLGPSGFVRTHRSWLINPGRVRELEPAGSGDFTVRLDGGLEAPLSRRFPEALRRLRPA